MIMLSIRTSSIDDMTFEERKEIYGRYLLERQKKFPHLSGYNPKVLESSEKIKIALDYLFSKGLIEKRRKIEKMEDNYIEYPNGNKLYYLREKGGKFWNPIYKLEGDGIESKEVYLLGDLPPFRKKWSIPCDPFLKEGETILLDSFSEGKIYMISSNGDLTEVIFPKNIIENNHPVDYDEHNTYISNFYTINEDLFLVTFGGKVGYGAGLLKSDGTFLNIKGYGVQFIDWSENIEYFSKNTILFSNGDEYLILNLKDISIIKIKGLSKGEYISKVYYESNNGELFCEINSKDGKNEQIGKIDSKGNCKLIKIKDNMQVFQCFITDKKIFFSVFKGFAILVLDIEKFELKYFNENKHGNSSFIKGVTPENIIIGEQEESNTLAGILFMDSDGNYIVENIPTNYKYPEIDYIDYNSGKVIITGFVGEEKKEYVIPFKTAKDFKNSNHIGV